MGYVTCQGDRGLGPTHRERRCCWRCDRCPTCQPETGRLYPGDYCRDCVKALKTKGAVWSEYREDYVLPDMMVVGEGPGEYVPNIY